MPNLQLEKKEKFPFFSFIKKGSSIKLLLQTFTLKLEIPCCHCLIPWTINLRKKMNSIEIDVKLGGTDRCNTILLESLLYVAMSPSNLETCTYKIVKKTTFFLMSNETPVKNKSFWSFLSFATFYWTFLNLIRPLDWLLEHYLCYYLSHIDTANGIWIGNRRILAMICKPSVPRLSP